MRIPTILALAAATAITTAAPAAADTTLAAPPRETPVDTFAGHLLYSVYVPAADGYRLTVRAPDGAVRTLPIAPQPGPFDADIGSDSGGAPQAIYTKCDTTGRGESVQRANCDLFVFSLVRNTGERAVANANTTDSSEQTPTIWRGRIAFSRVYRGRALPIMYTKELVAPRSRPSQRVAGIPARRNGRAVTDGAIYEAELYGRNLGLSVGFVERDGESRSDQREVRLSFIDGGARQVAAIGQGIGGQRWIGVSFEAGRMQFALTCLADGGGCVGRSGIYRYSISRGGYTRARSGFTLLFGHAMAGLDRAVVVRRCITEPDRPGPCPIVLSDPLALEAVRPPT